MRRQRKLNRGRVLLALLTAALCAILYGCNTVAGIGEDISSASQSTEEFLFDR